MYFDNMMKAMITIIVIWLASLVFFVAASMHVVKLFNLNVNTWLVGGITAVVWIIVSAIWLYIVNTG